MIRSMLIHLSMNMWSDFYPPILDDPEYQKKMVEENRPYKPDMCVWMPKYRHDVAWHDTLQVDDSAWGKVTEYFAKSGGNTLFIDVGDGVVFRSHPEIAIAGAWSVRKLKEELKKIRDLGITPYPKLNFSSCHDAWMKTWSRRLSTPEYYAFCRDVIAETAEIFGNPACFHVGMDEETAQHQAAFGYVVVRQGTLWWDDLNFYFDEVRRNGARPVMWSDKLWHCEPEEFTKNVPSDVIQQNWYYDDRFDFPETPSECEASAKRRVDTFGLLDRLGYDQIPAGSIWAKKTNYAALVRYCKAHIPQKHLLGFCTAPWFATEEENLPLFYESCDQIKREIPHE